MKPRYKFYRTERGTVLAVFGSHPAEGDIKWIKSVGAKTIVTPVAETVDQIRTAEVLAETMDYISYEAA